MNPDPLANFPSAPQWSLWTGAAGKAFVIAGLCFFLLSVVLSLLSKKREGLTKLASGAFALGCLSVFATMACLTALFVGNQFQYEYVFGRAAVETDLKYKVAGVWSGQQGSFLLWGCTSALFGLLALRGTGPYRRPFTVVFATFLAALCGILAYETPFNLLKDVVAHGRVLLPPDGNGMTPSLQNYWVVIHPPTIFLGFGCLTVLFAYAVAAMTTGDVSDWARRARPWCLLSLAILGLGISMGGLWAYETLGWGGFWMWDPVENASLVPWIFTAALTHGLIVQIAKGKWVGANLILAALPFLTFLYGTFLTRSGLLADVSVHSFAQMDGSALQILKGLLIVSVVGFAGFYLVRGRALAKAERPTDEEEQGVSREGLYRWSVLMLSLLGLTIAVGMSWPFFMALSGRKEAVIEEALYHRVVIWFFAPLMLLMAVAPFVSWRAMGPRALFARVINVFSVSFGLLGASLFFLKNPLWGVQAQGDAKVPMPFGMQIALLPWMLVLLFLCLFVAVANLWRVAEIWRRSKPSVGGFIAHVGIAMLLGGLILSRGFERKEELIVREDRTERALDYVVQFKGLTDPTLRDRDGKAMFQLTGERGSFTARPGLYYSMQNGEEKPMVWPHVERLPFHDVYFALGEPQVAVWQGPETFQVGETRTVKHPYKNVTITYLGMVKEGEAGMAGTSFGARLKVKVDDHAHDVTPKLLVGEGPDMPQINEDFRISMAGMDAANKSVRLQLFWATPLYPVTMYYKPMTSLVWLGTGIMTLGGLIAAVARRRRTVPVTAPLEPAEEASPSGGMGTSAAVPTT